MNDYELARRDLIEAWLRAAIHYGWTMGRAGSTVPDVMFDWAAGYPEIVAAMVEPETK